MVKIKSLSAFVLLSSLPWLNMAHAADFPTKPLRIVVPYLAGGTADIVARAFAEGFSKELGQPVMVENRPGAGGTLGMALVAKAKPDGYTLGEGAIGTQTISPYLYRDLAYNPDTDFTTLALAAKSPNVIAVSASSDIKTLADLIRLTKEKKDAISYASPGIGSSVHLSGAYLGSLAGLEWTHIPYKGMAESLPALIGQQVTVLFDNLPSLQPHIKSGDKVRALAVTSKTRSEQAPDVPTVAESGFEGFDVNAWWGIHLPKGVPADRLKILGDAAKKVVGSAAYQAKLKSIGATPGDVFLEDFHAFEKSERARWKKIVQDNKITITN